MKSMRKLSVLALTVAAITVGAFWVRYAPPATTLKNPGLAPGSWARRGHAGRPGTQAARFFSGIRTSEIG